MQLAPAALLRSEDFPRLSILYFERLASGHAQTLTAMNVFTRIVRQDLLGTAPLDKNMTFAVKANIGCGYATSSSTPSLRDWIPLGFSPVVRHLLDHGHQIVAIANMHELASGATSENPAFGDVDNPRKPGYIPGGSSGGSAAAVAMNAVSFALGTDTAGSNRIPASLCGVVGYRPSTGLYSTSAMCPLATTTDTVGVFANQVSTVQQVHKAINLSYTPKLRPLSGARIGIPRQYYYSFLDSEVRRVTEAALLSLRETGVVLVECDINFSSDYDVMLGRFLDLIKYETAHCIPKYLKEQGAPVSFEQLCEQLQDPVVKEVTTSAHKVSEERYRECQQDVQDIRGLFDAYFTANQLDGFVVPTTIIPALKRPCPANIDVGGHVYPTLHALIHNSIPQAIAGVPCISIPSGLSSDGLPIGLELVSPRDMDSSLLDLAAALQAVMPQLPYLELKHYLLPPSQSI